MERQAAMAKHYMVGGGIASLAAAVLLARDGGVTGDRIVILEHGDVTGGSLDGAGDTEAGYLTRGGRMFEPNFVCTLNLLGAIPSPDDPTITVRDDILAFNRMVPGWAECRLVRHGGKAGDQLRLGLRATDVFCLNRLLLTPESWLEGRSIKSWFAPTFFDTNFWIMWSTMFSFRRWHSLAEMRRYLKRFLHLFPGLTRIAGVLRTRYNQYDLVIAPISGWLASKGVEFRMGCRVSDVTIEGDTASRRLTVLQLATGERIAVEPEDKVYLTLGSMTDATVTGHTHAPPQAEEGPSPGFDLWRRIADRHDGMGRPEVFAGSPEQTSWTSFTVTLPSPAFVTFMEDFSSNRTGTGGLVTFVDLGMAHVDCDVPPAALSGADSQAAGVLGLWAAWRPDWQCGS